MAKKAIRDIQAYDITLPLHLHPNLDKLFSINKEYVNKIISDNWNEEKVNEISKSKYANIYLQKILDRPKHIPSRVWRNILELAGRTLKSSKYSQKCFYDILDVVMENDLKDIQKKNKYDQDILDDYQIKKRLHAKALYYPFTIVRNRVRQLQNLIFKNNKTNNIKEYIKTLDFYEVVKPEFNGNTMLLEIDDGQFRKIRYYDDYVSIDLKLPDLHGNWKWHNEIDSLLYDKVIDALEKGKPVSPILQVEEKDGYKNYYFTIRVEHEIVIDDAPISKTFSLDQGIGTNALVCGNVVEKLISDKGIIVNTSRPMYLQASKMIKKIKRMKELAEHLGKLLHNKKHVDWKTRCTWKTQRKNIWQNIRNLKKEILEILSNEIIYLCNIFGCKEISVENLKFTEDFTGAGFISWLKSTWFFSQLEKKLRYKGRLCGISVKNVQAAGTSQRCLKCDGKLKQDEKNKRVLVCCKNEKHKFDRDYVGSTNVGKVALAISDLYEMRCGIKCLIPLSAVISTRRLKAYSAIINIPNVNCIYGFS